jgi:hypothetical protein
MTKIKTIMDRWRQREYLDLGERVISHVLGDGE